MRYLGNKGQGEALIKLLVVAIIAIIAIALAKSYFRESSKKTQKTVSEIFNPASVQTSLSGPMPVPSLPLIPGPAIST